MSVTWADMDELEQDFLNEMDDLRAHIVVMEQKLGAVIMSLQLHNQALKLFLQTQDNHQEAIKQLIWGNPEKALDALRQPIDNAGD